jgi:hypothetical protein
MYFAWRADVDPLTHSVRDLVAGERRERGERAAPRGALRGPPAAVPGGPRLRHQGTAHIDTTHAPRFAFIRFMQYFILPSN